MKRNAAAPPGTANTQKHFSHMTGMRAAHTMHNYPRARTGNHSGYMPPTAKARRHTAATGM